MGIAYTSLDTTKLSTAEVYAHTLCEIAQTDPRIVTLTADLAKSTKIGVFQEHFPDRFVNLGIAEQNMFGIAAGMAACGLIPFTCTFAIFNSCRALDQVHTDICYQNLNVKMIASHAGTSFGQAGSTHHATEDIAIMRTMANLVVLVPADGQEAAAAVRAAIEHQGPVYIRINRGFDQVVYPQGIEDFQIGKANLLKDGSDLCFIACGSAVFSALQAARELEAEASRRACWICTPSNPWTRRPSERPCTIPGASSRRRIIPWWGAWAVRWPKSSPKAAWAVPSAGWASRIHSRPSATTRT